MGLKIVGGAAKGRKLRSPKTSSIRPATAKVRESMFQILGDLSNLEVLDLFAGSGAVGLEALSRGAKEVVFVDSGQAAVSLLFENLEKLGFLNQAYVLKKKAKTAIEILVKKKRSFDLIFVDPPYDCGLVQATLRQLERSTLLAPEGLLLCEHSPRELPEATEGLEKVDERHYGQTFVSFFKRKTVSPAE